MESNRLLNDFSDLFLLFSQLLLLRLGLLLLFLAGEWKISTQVELGGVS